jgi:8-oxo-dGTP pyrophosphatase MutT (NUDIX family)
MGHRAPSRALQQLARIEAGLRKPQPTRTGDRSSVVAAILRRPELRPVPSSDDGLDLLFILRGGSTDPTQGSRWSGQVAFPGGHVEERETDLEAVARECREEVGIRDLAGSGYRALGRIADRSVYRPEKQSSLLVRCYVFEQLVHEALSPDPSEVSACGWAPLQSLLSDDLIHPLPPVSRDHH